jgi:hypothetical protein
MIAYIVASLAGCVVVGGIGLSMQEKDTSNKDSSSVIHSTEDSFMDSSSSSYESNSMEEDSKESSVDCTYEESSSEEVSEESIGEEWESSEENPGLSSEESIDSSSEENLDSESGENSDLSSEENSSSESVAPHEHNFSLECITPDFLCEDATCEKAATYYYACSCGEKGRETFPYGDSLGHDLKEYAGKEPTCKESGWEPYLFCEREGCNYSTFKALPLTDEHDWGEGKVTKSPTCTEEGARTFLCSVCGEEKTEPIDVSPHEYTEDWKKSETQHWKECVCGDKDGLQEHVNGGIVCSICEYPMPTEGIRYEVVEGKAKVVGYSGLATTVRIADSYNGAPVVEIGANAFDGCERCTEIIIPDTVKRIGDYAFRNCSGLSSVTIPDSVESIGIQAFFYCYQLVEVKIGGGVSSIGKDVFLGCEKLSSVVFTDTKGWYWTKDTTKWENKTGGDSIEVDDPLKNASNFTDKKKSLYYWYKL